MNVPGTMLAAVMAMATVTGAQAGTSQATPQLSNAQVAHALAQMRDPDALVTSALMQPSVMNGVGVADQQAAFGRMTTLLEKAQRLDPDAADITVLTMFGCRVAETCDAVAMGRRLHRMDPDNAVAWLPRLQQAFKQGTPGEVTGALQHMAQSGRYDSHWVRTLRRLDHGLALAPSADGHPRSADQRALYALSLAETSLPGYAGLIRSCKPGSPDFAARKPSCRRIGVMMERSPMLVTNMVGALLHRRAASNRGDYDRAVAYTRGRAWLNLKMIQLDKQVAGANGAEAYLRGIEKHGSEAGGIRAQLQRAHIPVRPPGNWIDPVLARRLQSEHSPYRTQSGPAN